MKRDKLPYLLPIRSVVFLIIFLAGSRITSKQLNDMSSWWTTVATIVNILTVIMLIYISRKNDMTYLDLIGYRKGDTSIKQIVIISIMILSVGGGGMYLAGFLCYGILPYSPPMMIAPVPKVLALINFFLLPVNGRVDVDVTLLMEEAVGGFYAVLGNHDVCWFTRYSLSTCFVIMVLLDSA